jgi:hypothetical protein
MIAFAVRILFRQQRPNGRRAWRHLKEALRDGKITQAEWIGIGMDLGLF